MANISQIKIIEIQPNTSTKWTWKQSEAFKCGMVITRSIWGGHLLIPALTSPAPAANEECLSQRGGKHCRNSLFKWCYKYLTDFYAIFIHYFSFFHLFEIFENIWKSATFMPFTFYRKTPLDKINKIKHRLSWIRCNIHMEDNIYNIKHISRPILPPIQQGQPAAVFLAN